MTETDKPVIEVRLPPEDCSTSYAEVRYTITDPDSSWSLVSAERHALWLQEAIRFQECLNQVQERLNRQQGSSEEATEPTP